EPGRPAPRRPRRQTPRAVALASHDLATEPSAVTTTVRGVGGSGLLCGQCRGRGLAELAAGDLGGLAAEIEVDRHDLMVAAKVGEEICRGVFVGVLKPGDRG